MSLQDQIKADLALISTDLGNPIATWKGEEYEVVPGSSGDVWTLEEGGFSDDADVILNIRKELFTDDVYPASQQLITYLSKVYRIITARADASGAFIRLFCADNSRGV